MIFLYYATTQSARALGAFAEVKRLASIVEETAHGVERRENSSIFVEITLALHYAAAVRRVFWPTERSAKPRGLRLRSLAGLPDEGHPLNKAALRNHIEHLDERLDRWTAQSPREFLQLEWVIHDNWPDEGKARIIEATTVAYDAKYNRVHILGERFDLADLEAAVLDVSAKIQAALRCEIAGQVP